jgi:CspA family cold shock protein
MSSKNLKQTWQLGTVRWFDDVKGEGLIRDENGKSFYVHYSAIQSEKKHKTLREESEVKFQLLEDSHYTQVAKVKAA